MVKKKAGTKPTIPVSIRALMARLNRIPTVSIRKYYRRDSIQEPVFVWKDKSKEDSVVLISKDVFELMAREVGALEPFEFLNVVE
jgi:hypothetical protein